jgi:sarcosine oxidase
MKTDNYDCVVLGLGAMGSATLYTLAHRRVKVCGIEQFGIAHDRGSSHGETRIIRKAYFEHPDYIPLLNRSYELWDDLVRASGKDLFVRCPMIVAGRGDADAIKGLQICYRNYDLPHERLNAAEAAKRYPQFHLPDDFIVYVDPIAGFLHPEKCVETYVNLARDLGATVHTNEKVISWRDDNGKIRIRTDRREIASGKLIITAGAWANRELASLTLPLQVSRRVVFWYDSYNLPDFEITRFPIFYVESKGRGFYGFPTINSGGLKVAEHTTPQFISDPDNMPRSLSSADEQPVLEFLREFLPSPKLRQTKFSVCMYTMSPDGNFIIDHHPNFPNVVFAAGFSGHGFKFASVFGEILADLAMQHETTHPIDFLRLNRFR